MCDKNALPSPCPSLAPLTKPAMSTTFKNAGTLLKSKNTNLKFWKSKNIRFKILEK